MPILFVDGSVGLYSMPKKAISSHLFLRVFQTCYGLSSLKSGIAWL